MLLLGTPYSSRTDSLALSRSLHYDLLGSRKLSLASVELRNVQPADRVLPESPDHPAKGQNERDSTITQGFNPSPDSLTETGREAALPDAPADREEDGENPADGQDRGDPLVAAHGIGCRLRGRQVVDGTSRTGPSGWAVELFGCLGRAAVDFAALLPPFPDHRTARWPFRMSAVRQVPDLAVLRFRKP